MTAPGEPIWRALLRQEQMLVAKGFVPISSWWFEALGRFLKSTATTLVARVGRQGGKSTTSARVATATGCFVDHRIPPGTRGVVAFLSVRKTEAEERLRNIEAILRALGVAYRQKGEVIELAHRPIIFATYAASYRTAVGFTCVSLHCDEVARWRDDESGANPAAEVIGSAMPTLVTQPLGRAYVISSPLGTEDYHATAFDRGDTATQLVAEAPTWLANPTVTEERTRELEPDERRWLREYAAVPQAGAVGAFDVDAIARAFEPRAYKGREGLPIMVIDPSSGGVDAFTWGICRRAEVEGERRAALRFDVIDGETAKRASARGFDALCDTLAGVAAAHGCARIVGDQRESFALASALGKRGKVYTPIPWTASNKPAAVEMVRRWLSDAELALPRHETMRRELLAFEEKIAPSGQLTYTARRRGHDDYVALLITAALAEQERLLPSASARGWSADDSERVRRAWPSPRDASIVGTSTGADRDRGGGWGARVMSPAEARERFVNGLT